MNKHTRRYYTGNNVYTQLFHCNIHTNILAAMAPFRVLKNYYFRELCIISMQCSVAENASQ